MRVVLLLLFVCGLSVAVTPEPRVVKDQTIASAVADDSAGQAQYEALQAQADLALVMLRQARERRLAAAQFAAN